MNHKLALTTVLIVGLAIFVALTPTAQADDQCSAARVAGEWGFTDTGSVAGVGPRAAVGTFTLDAMGNVLNGKATVNLNGGIAIETFTGKSTVNADCSASSTTDLFDQSGNKIATVTAQGVFVDNMQELRDIFTSVVLANGTPLATVITLDAKKIFPGKQQ